MILNIIKVGSFPWVSSEAYEPEPRASIHLRSWSLEYDLGLGDDKPMNQPMSTYLQIQQELLESGEIDKMVRWSGETSYPYEWSYRWIKGNFLRNRGRGGGTDVFIRKVRKSF